MTAQTDEAKKVYVPRISDERLEELAKRIKPIVQMERVSSSNEDNDDGSFTITTSPDPEGDWVPWRTGEKYFIKDVDLRGVAYTWSPEPTKLASNLKTHADITTYHAYGYYGMFKPSIAEVLAQIPEEYVDKIVAFEIIKSPETAKDFNYDLAAFNAGYHVATTRLYTTS
jgi:hypothetical protein